MVNYAFKVAFATAVFVLLSAVIIIRMDLKDGKEWEQIIGYENAKVLGLTTKKRNLVSLKLMILPDDCHSITKTICDTKL